MGFDEEAVTDEQREACAVVEMRSMVEDWCDDTGIPFDDALDAFGCHGIGGIWGGIATGLFGKSSINSAVRWNGLFFGDVHLFLAQLAGIGITIAIAVVGTLVCIGIVRIFTKIRVDDRSETIGLDLSEHGEKAYPSFNGWD